MPSQGDICNETIDVQPYLSTMATTTSPQDPSSGPNDINQIQLNILIEQTEHDRLEQQPEVSNATAAMTPLEISGVVQLKVASAALGFFNAGLSDGSLGALIPYILANYNHNTSWMAIPYGVGLVGWLIAAVFGGYLRVTLGTGGYMIAGAALQLLAHLLRFWVPPFGVFSASFLVVYLGQAFQDSQANTFVSSLKKAHRWLGVIHGCYALGGLVGPLVAAAIASSFKGHWASFYYVPIGIGAINLLLCSYAFRDETALYQRIKAGRVERPPGPRRSTTARVELFATLKQKSVWLLSVFFFLYLGAAITVGGWVVDFLLVVRHGPLSRVGYISSAFYGGLALGRFLLAEPTFRFGEKRMLLLYSLVSLALQIVFWRVQNVIVDAVMVSLMGFLLGPAFATGVSVGSKLIPAELQTSGLGEYITTDLL